MATIRVMQFICPRRMYGAERWILALNNHLTPDSVISEIAVTREDENQDEVIHHFEGAGQVVHKVEMRSKFSISTIRNLRDLIKERRIDIIHTHGYKSDILGWIAARLAGISVISTPHGFGEPVDLKHKAYIMVGKWFLRLFDRVVPLSHQLECEVLGAGVSRQRVTLIRNAVDLDEVDSYRRRKKTKEGRKQIVGYVGQLIPRKKIDHMLEIFDQVWLEDKKLELQILGDGESRLELEQYARTLSSNAAIHFLGFRDDRMKFLKDFDLFVMTSSDEGIPRCLMEAIAMGIPVAAYSIPGIEQLVVHEKTGLLAAYGDKSKLKSYWQRMLCKKVDAQKLAEHGRQHIIEKYSAQRMASEYAALYRSLLLKKAGS